HKRESEGIPPGRWIKCCEGEGVVFPPHSKLPNVFFFPPPPLHKPPPFSRLDLISCRNVLIYLDKELQDRLLRSFHYALLPSGYLFLGSAESATRNSRLFTAREKKHRILQRRDAGAILPAFQSLPTLRSPAPPARRHPGEDRIDNAVGRVMQQYAPAYFVIDGHHEISRCSGPATAAWL